MSPRFLKGLLAGGASLCVLAGMMVGLPTLFASSDSDDQEPHGQRVSVLERNPRSGDALPGDLARNPFARSHYPDASSSRLAATVGNERVFVVRGVGDELCLV